MLFHPDGFCQSPTVVQNESSIVSSQNIMAAGKTSISTTSVSVQLVLNVFIKWRKTKDTVIQNCLTWNDRWMLWTHGIDVKVLSSKSKRRRQDCLGECGHKESFKQKTSVGKSLENNKRLKLEAQDVWVFYLTLKM